MGRPILSKKENRSYHNCGYYQEEIFLKELKKANMKRKRNVLFYSYEYDKQKFTNVIVQAL